MRCSPKTLSENMMKNSFIERRRPGRLKFNGNSVLKIANNKCFMNKLNFDWLPMISDGLLRKNLKRHFKMATHQVEVFRLGGAKANSSKNPVFP